MVELLILEPCKKGLSIKRKTITDIDMPFLTTMHHRLPPFSPNQSCTRDRRFRFVIFSEDEVNGAAGQSCDVTAARIMTCQDGAGQGLHGVNGATTFGIDALFQPSFDKKQDVHRGYNYEPL